MSKHVERYLRTYRALDAPGFAVLVTGDWGAGKTFAVREAFGSEHYYVSLFGMSSADEVYGAVYSRMFPIDAWGRRQADQLKDAKVGVPGLTGLPLGNVISGLASLVIRDKVKRDKVIVLDDLERASMDQKVLLGVINRYVEHHGCNVVAIAHDETLIGYFVEAKEKVFGYTLHVEPNIDDAYARFADEHPRSATILEEQGSNIKGVFRSSDAKSLRVLRQVVADCLRLYDCVGEHHRSNRNAVAAVFSLFAALDIEVRMSNLNREDLCNRRNQMMGHHMAAVARNGAEREDPPFVAASLKYKDFELQSSLLKDDFLTSALVDGNFDSRLLKSSLDDSAFFVAERASPAWLRFMHLDELPSPIVAAARDEMLREFDQRTIVEHGELLHHFSVRLMMAENGILERTMAEACNDCLQYITEVEASGLLPPAPMTYGWSSEYRHGFAGFGFWVTEATNEEFQRIYSELIAARSRRLRSTFAAAADELLTLVENDTRTFAEKISGLGGVEATFGSVPVLGAVEPDAFVRSWLRSDSANWHLLKVALTERYRRGFRDELREEIPWLNKVVRRLQHEADVAEPILRLKIRRAVPHVPELPAAQRDAEPVEFITED